MATEVELPVSLEHFRDRITGLKVGQTVQFRMRDVRQVMTPKQFVDIIYAEPSFDVVIDRADYAIMIRRTAA